MPAGDGDEPTVDDAARHTVYVSARSVLLVVAAIGLALVTRNVIEKSTRVLGWFADPLLSSTADGLKPVR